MEQADKDFFKTVGDTYHKVFADNANTFWGPLMMISLTSYLTPGDSAMYNQLAPDVQQSYYGKKVHDEIYPAGQTGSAAPVFTVKDDNGKELTLAQLSEGKKYVLLDFWASWCHPCRMEIPNLKAQYKLYSKKGFQIISISIDKKKSDWEKALKEEQLPWPNFLDLTGVAGLYKVRMIPTMYLFDGQGKVVGENLRGQALADKLAELFK
jgi:peroxiredoxin